MYSTDTTLPPEVRDRSAWHGAELAEREDWIERLSEVEIAEVQSAVEQLEKSQTVESNLELAARLTSITPDDLPFPSPAGLGASQQVCPLRCFLQHSTPTKFTRLRTENTTDASRWIIEDTTGLPGGDLCSRPKIVLAMKR